MHRQHPCRILPGIGRSVYVGAEADAIVPGPPEGRGMKLSDEHRTWWMVLTIPVVVLVLLILLGGCGDGSRTEEAPAASALRWDRVAGADAYRVRAWSGTRLLFEETSRADSLRWTPALLRTVRAFDTVTVRVQALDERGGAIGDPYEREVAP